MRNLKQRIWMALLMFTFVAGVGMDVMAQDEPADPANATTVQEKVKKKTLLTLIKDGGLFMIPLGILSIAVVSFVVRNFLALKEDKLLRPDLIPTIQEQLANHDVVGAYELCQTDDTLITSVVAAGLERITEDEIEIDVIKEAIEEAGTEQLMTFMTPISYLSIIGAVSPMVGLLGTVSGMIKAFQNIAVGGMGKAELLASNISEALVTTATGLVIAIPAMIFYFFFKNKFMKIMATASRISGTLLDTLKTGQMPAVGGDMGGGGAMAEEEVAEEE